MRSWRVAWRSWALAAAVGLWAPGCSCGPGTAPDAGPPDAALDADPWPPPPVIGAVEETRRFRMPGLGAPGYVVYTEHEVPHVYASTREDAVRILGFAMARDRFFVMDLARRLSDGRVAELLGQDGLPTDLESVGTGMRSITERSLALLTPEQGRLWDAFAQGVNDYIEQVRARRLFAPKEYRIAAPVFGLASPADMMAPFGRRDVVAASTAVLFELGFETGDVGRDRAARALDGLYAGEAFEALRRAGAREVFSRVTSANGYASAGGWGLEGTGATSARAAIVREGRRSPAAPAPRSAPALLARLDRHLGRVQRRLGRDHEAGFGSNAWVVSGDLAADGRAILASDGHLGGSVPTLFWRFGIDTILLGDLQTRQVGLGFPGLPILAVGTNGQVAWSQTQLFGDITDWYAEELVLDGSGEPVSTRFEGTDRALRRIDERYEVADLPALGSVGRTESWARFETFDGRPITAIEGREVDADYVPAPGEAVVNVLGDLVVPGDEDRDGVVSAVSFDYAALDGTNFALSVDRWGHAATVAELYASSGALVGYSQNVVAADAAGSILYSPYQAVPCRAHLPREADGSWSPGADPGRLIDGTRFGGFELPLTAAGEVDEAAGTEPHRCVVPLDAHPAAIDPARGYLVTANNDPGTMAQDGSLTNDPWYIGGPWHEDFRAARIDQMLAAAGGAIDEEAAAAMQADLRSPLGALLVPYLLESIEEARVAAAGMPAAGTAEARMAARFVAAREDLEEVERRLSAWRDRGYRAPSGVDTFYAAPTAEDRRDAVATAIFNAWLGPFDAMVFGDEGFPGGIFAPTGAGGRMRILTRILAGRGASNPLGLPEHNPATGESVFFDVRGTDEVETSAEIAVLAIDAALSHLRSPPTGPGSGGFGTDAWDAWLWGLRHHTRFESLISDFIDPTDSSFGFIVASFSITPTLLPLADSLPEGDPRRDLPGFPRGGDNFTVDAANSGFSGTSFTFGSIPVFRMVVALGGEGTTGRNVLPAGQSGDPDTPDYADQTRLWLANEASPMRLTPEQVVAGAVSRETYVP